ncbi:MAG: enoyl-CoA hydratase/isomerase family protein, partial [Ottowia sp.]|nr:enoyl-CoA hydratase/isomerase family protein [Ottowia sp.]
AFRQMTASPDVRVVLFTGQGDRAFVAGADIGELDGATPRQALVIASRIRAVIDAMLACPKPIVAVINGLAYGGGFELALASDIRIASSRARFCLPEIKLGIIPGAGGSVRLAQIAGAGLAKQMTMTGEPIDAARAWQLGIVSSIHDPDDLGAAAAELAGKLAASATFALAQLKQVIDHAADAPTNAALENEVSAFALC